jgi:hypothetical protein
VRLFLGLLATMLAVGAISFWAWRAAPEAQPCQDRAVEQSRSPDGRTLADVFEKRCGDSVSTHVALRPSAAPREARVDVFIAAGGVPVHPSWNGGRELVLESPARRVLVEEPSWRGVLVRVRRIR